MKSWKRKKPLAEEYHGIELNDMYASPSLLELKKRAHIKFAKVVFKEKEPVLFRGAQKKVDLILVLEGDVYYIVAIELKTGGRMKEGFEQLRTAFKFFSRNWLVWLDDKIEYPKEKDVYLLLVLLWNPDKLLIQDVMWPELPSSLPRMKKLGRYVPSSVKALVSY